MYTGANAHVTLALDLPAQWKIFITCGNLLLVDYDEFEASNWTLRNKKLE